jgi:hypothetical protein
VKRSYNYKRTIAILSLIIFGGIILFFSSTKILANDYEVVSAAYFYDQKVSLNHLFVIERDTLHDAIDYFEKNPPKSSFQDNFISHQGKLNRIRNISLRPNEDGHVGFYSNGALDPVPASETLTWPYIASTNKKLLYRNQIQTVTSEEDINKFKPASIPAEDISQIILTDLDNNGQLDKITLYLIRDERDIGLPCIAINLNTEEEFKLVAPGARIELLREIDFVGAVDWNRDGAFELVFNCKYYESDYYLLVDPFNRQFIKSRVQYYL